MKRTGISVLGLTVAAVALLGGVSTASADPTNAKNAQTEVLECTGGITGTIEIVLNGNGEWTPGHVVGSNQMLIPYAFEFTSTFTPSGGGDPVVETESFAKNAPNNGRLTECTFGETVSFPEGTLEFTGVVNASYTPAH